MPFRRAPTYLPAIVNRLHSRIRPVAQNIAPVIADRLMVSHDLIKRTVVRPGKPSQKVYKLTPKGKLLALRYGGIRQDWGKLSFENKNKLVKRLTALFIGSAKAEGKNSTLFPAQKSKHKSISVWEQLGNFKFEVGEEINQIETYLYSRATASEKPSLQKLRMRLLGLDLLLKEMEKQMRKEGSSFFH